MGDFLWRHARWLTADLTALPRFHAPGRAEIALLCGTIPGLLWLVHAWRERRRAAVLRSACGVLAEVRRATLPQGPPSVARDAHAWLEARGVASDPDASAAPERARQTCMGEAEASARRFLQQLARQLPERQRHT